MKIFLSNKTIKKQKNKGWDGGEKVLKQDRGICMLCFTHDARFLVLSTFPGAFKK